MFVGMMALMAQYARQTASTGYWWLCTRGKIDSISGTLDSRSPVCQTVSSNAEAELAFHGYRNALRRSRSSSHVSVKPALRDTESRVVAGSNVRASHYLPHGRQVGYSAWLQRVRFWRNWPAVAEPLRRWTFPIGRPSGCVRRRPSADVSINAADRFRSARPAAAAGPAFARRSVLDTRERKNRGCA